MTYPDSELIINDDGSVFHLHLLPHQLADKVILVGDPDRVNLVASHFDDIECEVTNREFHTITGYFQQKRITVLSTGIGCDNIDIVINELDALANINFQTREDKPAFRQLTLVRIGTCGGLQPNVPFGTFIASVKSIGFDGLLNYYDDRNRVCDLHLEKSFTHHMSWNPIKGAPYVSCADVSLIDQIAADDMVRGITISCGGFYGPQSRQIRMKTEDPQQNDKVESFRYPSSDKDLCICNYEMESSALAGLSSILGHRAMTCCMVVANRYSREVNTDYKPRMNELILLVLERI